MDDDRAGSKCASKYSILHSITPDHKGFGTTLKPIEKKSRVPKGTDKLEAFITDTATNYFSTKNLPMKEILMIRECLKLIHFGMGNTLIAFEDKYYEYAGDRDINDKGLTIGGYESAWLADLVAAFVLENTQHMFKMTAFDGIYRDDGLVVMKGNWSKQDVANWP
jgi:hypothetical protein